VLDTIDRAELFMRQEVCKDLHISGLEAKPYGKAYQYLFEKFDAFLIKQLDPLIAAGIHVVVVGHSNVRRVQFPGLDGFDRWELKIHPSCANRLKEWCDAVLHLNWALHVVENEGKPKGVGGKERVIYTRHSASHDAKVRIDLPEKLPCTFSAIEPLLCGWLRPEKKPAQQQLAEAVADLAPQQVTAFLIHRKQIQDDQSILNVPTEYAREALGRIQEFRQAIEEFDFIPM
jgi:AAA domain